MKSMHSPGGPSAGQIIRQRRSLQACDGRTSIPAERFYRMLARVMPRAELQVARRPAPWDAIPWEPAIHFGLFVHRVDGIEPGLYALARDPGKVEKLKQCTRISRGKHRRAVRRACRSTSSSAATRGSSPRS